jgi:hypothetical protein
MSNDSFSNTSCLDAGQEAAPLAWFLCLLKEAIVGIMAEDQPASKKANALARLGNLYLKTDAAAELKRANDELIERVAEPEQRVSALGEAATEKPKGAAGPPAPVNAGSKPAGKPGKGKPPKPHSHDPRRPAPRRPARPRPPRKPAG